MKRWSPKEVLTVHSASAWESPLNGNLIRGAEAYQYLHSTHHRTKDMARAAQSARAVLNFETAPGLLFTFALPEKTHVLRGSLDQPLENLTRVALHSAAGKLAVGRSLLTRPSAGANEPFRMYLETAWSPGEMHYPEDQRLSGIYIPLTADQVLEGIQVMTTGQVLKQPQRYDPASLRCPL